MYSLRSVHPLLRELPLAVDGVLVGAVGDHFNSLAVPGLLGAVLGDHVELTDVVLKTTKQVILMDGQKIHLSTNLTSSTESGMHIRYSLVNMMAA